MFELPAAAREPAPARGLRGASFGDGLTVLALCVGEQDAGLLSNVDRERGLRGGCELSGEAGYRIDAVRVDGRVFDARRLGIPGGVEVVGLAAAAEGGVAEFAVEA